MTGVQTCALPICVKGVGECGVIAVAPAVVSAIEDALSPFGVRIDHAPVTPMQVVALIAAAGRDGRTDTGSAA